MAFNRALLSRILTIVVPAAVASAGCGNVDNPGEGEFTAQGDGECIEWPSAKVDGCPEVGDPDPGGDGGAGPCPSDPRPYMSNCGFAYTSIEPGAVKPGECCYDVTYGSGRPLLIGGGARTAAALVRDGWVADTRLPAVAQLHASAREAAAAAWKADALTEHASVASFSLLALDLVALGAPAELVAAALRAAVDEVRHAQICFSLAGAYAGSSLGPSTLPQLALARPSCDLRALVEDTVVAGCVGESLAACALAVRAAAADEPLRRLVRTMAMDEARHAALAWRIVAWAIQTGGQDIRDAAASALRRAVRAARSSRAATGAPHLPEHGLPGERVLFEAEQAALDEVVLPAAAALLHGSGGRAGGRQSEATA